jgi:hypothetical protein
VRVAAEAARRAQAEADELAIAAWNVRTGRGRTGAAVATLRVALGL